jgi:predicted Mrr-cat superfamily restriction endonuclease
MSKAWFLHCRPDYVNRMNEFQDSNIIALGYPELDSLVGNSKEDIKYELKYHYPSYNPTQIGAHTAALNNFVNTLSIGDIVVIPDSDSIFFCKVIGDYYYDTNRQNDGYPHCRSIEFLSGPVARDTIPNALKKALQNPRIIAEIKDPSSIVSLNNLLACH